MAYDVSRFYFREKQLVLFRHLLGLILAYEFASRLGDYDLFLGETGFLPSSAALRLGDKLPAFYYSLLTWVPNSWCVVSLITLGLVTSVLFGLGIRPRLFLFVSWLCLLSVHNRNPFACHGGDWMLRLLAFFALFLPLKSRELKSSSSEHFFQWGCFAYTLQVCLIYFFSALFKFGDSWRVTHTAIQKALQVESFAGFLAPLSLQFPEFLRWETQGVLLLEEAGPILILLMPSNRKIRSFVALLFITFHLGIALNMNLGIFPFVGCIAWVPFLSFREGELTSLPQTYTFPKEKYIHGQFAIATKFLQAVLLLIVLLNIYSLNTKLFSWMAPRCLRNFGTMLGLQQNWCLFAPDPSTLDGWLVCQVSPPNPLGADPQERELADFSRPPSLAATYFSCRHHKYVLSILSYDDQILYDCYLEYMLSKRDDVNVMNEPFPAKLMFMSIDPQSRHKPPKAVQLSPSDGFPRHFTVH